MATTIGGSAVRTDMRGLGGQDTAAEETSSASGRDPGDHLGYTAYANTLWARIQAALNKDAPADLRDGTRQPRKDLGDDPLVVGIFGEWGAGKSKLLSLIQKRADAAAKLRIKARKTDATSGLTVPVFFQPWKYEHEPHLLVPLLLHILAALEKALKDAQTPTEAVQQSAEKGGDWLADQLGKTAGSFKSLSSSAKAALVASDLSGSSAVLLGVASLLAGALPGFKNKAKRAAKDIAFEDDGRSYYEIHTTLKQITRPQKHLHTHPSTDLQHDIALNFVIFIDDLDRCLPEKAVAVLELIKTIFNAESFAFVLALDEEVVERGIGHRYKDYTLVGKKPEMPITGFEYLEKIVHLPFRLPALTRAQAVHMMQRYEQDLIAQRRMSAPHALHARDREAWFVSRPISTRGAGRGVFADVGDLEAVATDDAMSGKPSGSNTLDATGQMAGLASAKGSTPGADTFTLDLSALVIASFGAYVPRKLIRVVELFHQVLDVLDERKTATAFVVGGDAKTIDPRIALAHLLLQLFQPDLHRTLRRTGTGFDVLMAAFVPKTAPPVPQPASVTQPHLTAQKSDLDLLHWAVFYHDAQPPTTLRAAVQRVPKLVEETDRYFADRLRILIVERLLEHRAIARHVFDPLRLFAALQTSTLNGAMPLPDSTRWMTGLLAATPESLAASLDAELDVVRRMAAPVSAPTADPLGTQAAGETPVAAAAHGEPSWARSGQPTQAPAVEVGDSISSKGLAEWRTPTEVSDLEAVFFCLTARDEPEQRRAPEAARLQPGQTMSSANAQALAGFCRDRFLNAQGEANAAANAAAAKTERQTRLLRGLQYLAPHIARDDALQFWDLVKDDNAAGGLGEPFKTIEQVKQCALWADVRSMLGQDDRFDANRWYLPKARFQAPGSANAAQHSEEQEPIPGFVRVKAGEFTMDGQGDSDNPKQKVNIESDFYIARFLTTVDQFACFVGDKGYADDQWWDKQGTAWRNGSFESKVTDKAYKAHLARRTVASRIHPHDWEAQRSNGSRPVTKLNWFEARAYTRWLNAHLQSDVDFKRLIGSRPGLTALLPTEAQRERAARAKNFNEADLRRWPWGDEEKNAFLLANINDAKLGEASVVGLFGANPLGASDLAGNAWEWQDNLFDRKGETVQARLPIDHPLALLVDHEKSDLPALRGGSWDFTADNARSGFRDRNRPDGWDDFVGFRVVLSLA